MFMYFDLITSPPHVGPGEFFELVHIRRTGSLSSPGQNERGGIVFRINLGFNLLGLKHGFFAIFLGAD